MRNPLLDPNFLATAMDPKFIGNPNSFRQTMAAQPVMPAPNAMQAQGGGLAQSLKGMLPDILIGLGTGLASGNMAAGTQYLAQAAEQRQAQQRQRQASSATVKWLQSKNRPDLAELLDAGAIDAGEALRLTMAEQKPEMPASVQEYLFAKENGFTGSMADWKMLGRQAVTVNNNLPGGAPTDVELRKKLNEKTGEQWAGYQAAGSTAGQFIRDLDVLDELGKQAPQGPLSGNLAKAFPGFTNAGAAYQSVVSRIAPALRVEGSGSTSDIEYEGFLRSLPSLSNQPGGNAIITQVLRQKAQIEVERSEVVNAYSNGEIDAAEARRRIAEINRRSIMTPEMRTMLGVSAGVGPSAPATSGGFTIEEVQ